MRSVRHILCRENQEKPPGTVLEWNNSQKKTNYINYIYIYVIILCNNFNQFYFIKKHLLRLALINMCVSSLLSNQQLKMGEATLVESRSRGALHLAMEQRDIAQRSDDSTLMAKMLLSMAETWKNSKKWREMGGTLKCWQKREEYEFVLSWIMLTL